MARRLSHIQQEIRELSDSEKETLLRQLWEELDGPGDTDIDAAWLEEIERRAREIDDGAAEVVPADEVFAKIESSLRE
jgi:putative addiction module component (TIGR02574 family)